MTVKIKKNFQEKGICVEEEYSEKKRTVECSCLKHLAQGIFKHLNSRKRR